MFAVKDSTFCQFYGSQPAYSHLYIYKLYIDFMLKIITNKPINIIFQL